MVDSDWVLWIASTSVAAIILSISVFVFSTHYGKPQKSSIKIPKGIPRTLLGIKTIFPPSSVPDATKNCDIDILAVHGLGANPATTWTAKRDTEHPAVEGSGSEKREYINWLSHTDMLPALLPKARIMVFNHDSQWWGEEAVATRLDPLAKELIEKLKVVRKDCPNRPLMIIGHSLGGLIIEKALVDPLAPINLFRAVTSVILFGTPHGGTKHIGFPEILARIRNTGTHVELGLVNSLRQGNENILDTVNHFAELANRRNISVDCFFEGKQSVIAKMFDRDTEKAVIVDETSATLRSWPSHQLALDHFNLNKFPYSTDDGNWEKVQQVILDRYEEAPGKMQVRLEAREVPRSLVPYYKDPNFIGRRDILVKMQGIYEVHDCVALHGPGGVGKSQIAIQYAYEFREKNPYSWVFWVFAGTSDKFEKAFKDIAITLKLPQAEDPKVDTLALVTAWLNVERPRNAWLMILDNFDDVDVLYPSSSKTAETQVTKHKRNSSSVTQIITRKSLYEYLPDKGRCNILVTSRVLTAAYRIVSQNDRIIRIPTMSTQESLDLLQVKLPPELRDREHESCTDLVNTLDRLPLAIVQASAYIGINPQLTVSSYLEIFNDQRIQAGLLQSEDGVEDRREKSVPSSVSGTWLISFNQIAQKEGIVGKKAIELLYLMSFFDRHGVPNWLLADDKNDIHAAVGKLAAYCLIVVERGRSSYDMHRLVQIVTRNKIEVQNETNQWKFKALERLEQRFPSGELKTWKQCRELIPHFQAVKDYKLSGGQSEELRASLVSKKALYDEKIGMWEAVRRGRGEELEIRRTLTTNEFKDHDSLRAMDRIAWANFMIGNINDAEPMARRVLDGLRELLGDKHEDFLETLNNLAFMTDDEVLSKQALEGRRAILGDHQLTAESLNNYAIILTNNGEHELALRPNDEALALMKKIHKSDPNDPQILWCLEVRWNILGQLGRFIEAEKIARDVLQIRESVVGLEHIDTIFSLADCADASFLIKDYVSAESFAIRCLEASHKHPELGAKHPKTFEFLRNLAMYQRKQNKFAEAEKTYKKAFDIAEAVFGPQDDETWSCRVALGSILIDEGNVHEALKLLEDFLSKADTKIIKSETLLDETAELARRLEKLELLKEAETFWKAVANGYKNLGHLGPEHADTRRAINHLVSVYEKREKFVEAEQLLRTEHQLRMKSLGPKDESTMFSRRNLINVLHQQGNIAEAESVRQEELWCFDDTLESNIEKQEIMHILGRNLYNDSMFEEAETIALENLESRRELLGRDDLRTIQSMHLLGAIQLRQSRAGEAEILFREVFGRRKTLLGAHDNLTCFAMKDLIAALKEQGKIKESEELEALNMSKEIGN